MKKDISWLLVFIVCTLTTLWLTAAASYASFLDLLNGMFIHWTVYSWVVYFIISDIIVIVLLSRYIWVKDVNRRKVILKKIGGYLFATFFLLYWYQSIAPEKVENNRTYRPCLMQIAPDSLSSRYRRHIQANSPTYCPLSLKVQR